ncbi:PfkB family carbohydrate kinase [candidate division KSB1 bacterium]
MSLLVVGSIAFDTLETPSGRIDETLGGSGVYFSAAASYFSPSRVVAVVGRDFDNRLLDFVEKRGVDFKGVYVEDGETFRWGCKYHEDFNQRETVFTYLNVFQNFRPNIPEEFKESKYVFLANIDPDLQNEVLNQIKNPEFVVMDTMNFWINGKRESVVNVLKNVNGLILNDSEARELSGEYNLIKAAKIISEMGPEMVIVKKGEHGSFLYADDSFFFTPAYPLEEVIDPTGAGDSFAGGFMGYIVNTRSLEFSEFKKGIISGTIVASFCCESFGIERLKYLDKDELVKRTDEFLNMINL